MSDPETISVIRDVLAYNAVFPGLPGELVERMRRIVSSAPKTDAEIRANLNLRGKAAYEASLAAAPSYPDGAPRKAWDQLGDVERWSWERPVTINACVQFGKRCCAPVSRSSLSKSKPTE